MQTIVLRKAGMQDAARITEIYNSNPLFLQHHLGRCRVDESFVRNEMEEMERARFSSFLFVDLPGGDIVGLADVKAGACTYLSLMMLDARLQRTGKGALCYALLEQGCAETVRTGCGSTLYANIPKMQRGFGASRDFLLPERPVCCGAEKNRRPLSCTSSSTDRFPANRQKQQNNSPASGPDGEGVVF